MKKYTKAFCLLLILLIFSGCVPHIELNEKAIVLAIGIDYKEGLYKTIFQYYNPTGIGGRTLVDNSQPNVLIAAGEGENVYGALEDASFRCGRELMLGVTQLIIIGEEAAKYSVDKVINFTKSYFQSHPDMLVAISEGVAEDYLTVKFSEGIVSTQKLKFMLQNSKRNGIAKLPSALDLFIGLQTEERSACLPRLRLIEESKLDSSEEKKNVEISGGVLIKDGKAVDNTDIEVMSGLDLLCCRADTANVTVDYKGEKISVGLVDIKTKIRPTYENNRLVFNVDFKAKGRYLIEPHNSYVSDDNREINKLCGNAVVKRMTESVEQTVLKHGADPCVFEKVIRFCDYKLWYKIKEDYENVLKNSKFVFSVHIDIDKLILTK